VKNLFRIPYLKFWGIGVFIAIWWLIKKSFLLENVYLPFPSETFAKVAELFFSGGLLTDLIATLNQFFSGFLMACSLGIPLGLALGYFKRGYALFEIIIDFFRSIPVTALFPLFILFFGIRSTTITAMVFFACFFVILINSIYGVIYTNVTYFQVLNSLKATVFQKFTEVIFYEALPFLLVGLRVGISFGLIVVIVSEMFIGSQYGIGSRVYRAHETYLITDVYALTMIIGLIGYIMNKFILMVENKFVHWKDRKERIN
jgi:NitT/TauT family transport system permease protein